MNNGLSVGDGFKFGCGFFLAAFIVWLAIAIVGGILAVIFSTALSGILRNLDLVSQLPQLLNLL
jgi:hypothetical protein